jgi:hypothetical protein
MLSIIGLFGTQFSEAATYYVAPYGSESNTCAQAQSLATPVARIGVGVQCLSPGDTLMVREGVYSEMIGSFMYIPSGTRDNPITIMSYPGEKVTMEAPPYAEHLVLLELSYVQFITFKGFTFDGKNIASRTVNLSWPTSNIRLENNEIKNALDNGLFISGNSNEIVRNNIHSNGFYINPLEPPYGYGIYLVGASNMLDGNDIHNNAVFGLVGYNNADTLNNNIVQNNLVHDNEQMASSAGILMGGGNNLISSNTIWNERGDGIQIGFTNPRNITISRNTIYHYWSSAIVILMGSNIQQIDNIIYDPSSGVVAPPSSVVVTPPSPVVVTPPPVVVTPPPIVVPPNRH